MIVVVWLTWPVALVPVIVTATGWTTFGGGGGGGGGVPLPPPPHAAIPMKARNTTQAAAVLHMRFLRRVTTRISAIINAQARDAIVRSVQDAGPRGRTLKGRTAGGTLEVLLFVNVAVVVPFAVTKEHVTLAGMPAQDVPLV
jgi:hypothetical protein